MSKKLLFKPGQGTGDDGKTDLLEGRRVSKTHPVVKLNAMLDELDSTLGMMKAYLQYRGKYYNKKEKNCNQECGVEPETNETMESSGKNVKNGTDTEINIVEIIEEIQKALMKLSAVNAGFKTDISPEFGQIETYSRMLDEKVNPPRKFIIPGANSAEAVAHMARTKTRLCEIAAWKAELPETAKFLNRLSDLMFLIALYLR